MTKTKNRIIRCLDCPVTFRQRGGQLRCGPCSLDHALRRARAYYQAHREAILAQRALYHRTHRAERAAAAHRRYIAQNPSRRRYAER